VPPGPLHVNSNSVVLLIASVVSVPLVATEPIHPPELVQLVAPLLLQVSTALEPGATVVGLAEIETNGGCDAALCTVTLTDCDVEPPVPEQLNVKVAGPVRAAVVKLPDTGCVPVHPPDAMQDCALVDCQCSDAVSPDATDESATVNETVGESVVEVELPGCVASLCEPLL
jgi:hypothetical protein